MPNAPRPPEFGPPESQGAGPSRTHVGPNSESQTIKLWVRTIESRSTALVRAPCALQNTSPAHRASTHVDANRSTVRPIFKGSRARRESEMRTTVPQSKENARKCNASIDRLHFLSSLINPPVRTMALPCLIPVNQSFSQSTCLHIHRLFCTVFTSTPRARRRPWPGAPATPMCP